MMNEQTFAIQAQSIDDNGDDDVIWPGIKCDVGKKQQREHNQPSEKE